MNLQPSSDGLTDIDSEQVHDHVLDDPDVMQHITRTQSEGRDTFVGYFRCRFDAGQQRYALNIMIHPSMQGLPQVEILPLDHDQVRIRVTDAQRYGIRAEVILARPANADTSVLVEVVASSQAP